MLSTNRPKPKKHSLKSRLVAGVALCALAFGSMPVVVPLLTVTAHAETTQSLPGFADLVQKVRPAVVSVKVKVAQGSNTVKPEDFGFPELPPGHPLERFFKQFRDQGQKSGPKQFGMSQGSGFFISADGYVVTNNHVIENAIEVTVTTDDGKSLDAKVIGRDPKTDLALLKVDKSGQYPFVPLSAGAPRVGDWVVAVGNPFGLGGTVTAGIVSARGRDIGTGPYDDYLQIDAPVNRGNSGGPTFNQKGEVVGVNTAIYSPSGGSVGIAFAIPSETVSSVISALKESGQVARGYLGVQIQPVTEELADSLSLKEAAGALVAETVPGTPAFDAGLKPGDTITAINGESMAGPRELTKRISQFKPGESVIVTFVRDGQERTANVKLASLPDQQLALNDATGGRGGTGLGLTLTPSKDGVGVLVTEVDPNGAASEKGITKGDLIVEAGGKSVTRPADVRAAVDEARKDGRKALILRIKTENGSRFVAVPLPKA